MKHHRGAYLFKDGEMAILNVWQGTFEVPTDDNDQEIDTWGNFAYDLLPRTDENLYAPDFEGTRHESNGISVLMPTYEIDEAMEALKAQGFQVSVEKELHQTHFGDGYWEGVELLKFDSNDGDWILLVNRIKGGKQK